ncbi:lipocalin-like domain-containing protein [Hymenobacter terrenus]|uniref:lipocalin family protein n=1 Tax=Hymenobacter terrenus TaxID=1629124 RepID=UPI0006195511|nr:lipocalin family protein [Hymenobacter terrenus]
MKFLRLLLLPGLLFAAVSCKKDKEDPKPSKAAQLTAVTWKASSLTIAVDNQSNTSPTPSSNQLSYKFNPDGKSVVTYSDGSTGTGTWVLQSNDSELVLQDGSSSPKTNKLFELTDKTLSFGESFDKSAIQKVLTNSPGASLNLGLIIAGSSGVTWQNVNSVQLKVNYVPK